MDNTISTLYRADARYMRLQLKQKEAHPIEVEFIREGKRRKTTIFKKFRKFAMVSVTSNEIKWFKEYGDPREMCAVTGKYKSELKKNEKIIEQASEIIHIKQGNDTYGVPRWIGIAVASIGVKYADFVNYDLFENQAIPPLAVLVSGGRLTSESINDLQQILEARKGVENFSKLVILEAVSADDGEVTDTASNTRVDFKPLPQQNDILFKDYLSATEKRIRAKFRLPPLFSGQSEDYSRSTSDTARTIAEEQVFRPERNDFDEVINFTIMKDLGAENWVFKTIGPKLIEGSELIDAIGKFARAGAMSINQGIKVMNRVLDLDVPLFDDSWADFPAAIVLELAKRGYLKGIEEISNVSQVGDLKNNIEKTVSKLNGQNDYEDIMQEMETMGGKVEELYDLMLRGE